MIYPIMMAQGKFTHKDALTYPYEERGLQFGDGVYEVIRIYKGKPYLFQEHIDRLYRSLAAVRITISHSEEEIKKLLMELLEKNDMKKDGLIYLQITRGSSPRNHIFPENTRPNMYAYVKDHDRNIAGLNEGVKTITARDERWKNCYIKSLNLLPNVLAKQNAAEQGGYEAILHVDGKVTECSSSNIYLVKDSKIYTHPATNRILRGCVRIAVERFAKDSDIPFIEEAFTLDDINEADEMFLTSSLSEVLPVVQVDDKQIANGMPGTISQRLQQAYEKDAHLN